MSLAFVDIVGVVCRDISHFLVEFEKLPWALVFGDVGPVCSYFAPANDVWVMLINEMSLCLDSAFGAFLQSSRTKVAEDQPSGSLWYLLSDGPKFDVEGCCFFLRCRRCCFTILAGWDLGVFPGSSPTSFFIAAWSFARWMVACWDLGVAVWGPLVPDKGRRAPPRVVAAILGRWVMDPVAACIWCEVELLGSSAGPWLGSWLGDSLGSSPG